MEIIIRKFNQDDKSEILKMMTEFYSSNAVSTNGSIEIFEKDGRKQFNPIFLVPILNNLTNTYLQHYVELSNGMKGKIVLINKSELSRPMIAMDDNQFIDLLKQRDIKITQVR